MKTEKKDKPFLKRFNMSYSTYANYKQSQLQFFFEKISTQEKTALKKLLGDHYTSNVIEVLEKHNVKDTSGKTHSAEFIRQVFNGYREYLPVENAIVEAAQIEQKAQKVRNRKKKQLLKTPS